MKTLITFLTSLTLLISCQSKNDFAKLKNAYGQYMHDTYLKQNPNHFPVKFSVSDTITLGKILTDDISILEDQIKQKEMIIEQMRQKLIDVNERINEKGIDNDSILRLEAEKMFYKRSALTNSIDVDKLSEKVYLQNNICYKLDTSQIARITFISVFTYKDTSNLNRFILDTTYFANLDFTTHSNKRKYKGGFNKF